MRHRFLLVLNVSVVAAALLGGHSGPTAQQDRVRQSSREDGYRANNIGVALLEQFKYSEGAGEFRRALGLEPSLAIARVNLAIALYNTPDVEGAAREIKAAALLLPNSPQVHYLLGLIARSQNRIPEAISAFQQVLKIDPRDPGTNINLGQLLTQQRKYPEAITALREALSSEPYSVTATYNLAIALTRAAETQEGQTMLRKFQALRDKPYGITLGKSYLEQGRYAEAISSTGAEAVLVDTATPDVTFTNATSNVLPKSATAESRAFGPTPIGQSFKAGDINEVVKRQIAARLAGGVALFDFDDDGDMDLLSVGPRGPTLYRNDGGKFADVTSQSGFPPSMSNAVSNAVSNAASNAITVVTGDYDNDQRPDVFVLGYERLALYHNDGNGRFSDVTMAAGIPEYPYLALSTAFVDVDHDRDLDIFIAGFVDLARIPAVDPNRQLVFPEDFPAAPNMLIRNNGNGKFTDITAAAKVSGSGSRAVAVVPSDFDNHRDIDLLVVNYGATPALFSNQRDGTFRDVATEVGLNFTGRFTGVAAGDVNKDDFTDFFFSRADGSGLFAMSDGRGRFNSSPAPTRSAGVNISDAAIAAQFLDYDNDGLLDLVLLQHQGVRVLRNVGRNVGRSVGPNAGSNALGDAGTGWNDVTERAVSANLLRMTLTGGGPTAVGLGSADIDADGDIDLILSLATGDIEIARNDGGNRSRALKLLLTGRVSNRTAVGAKIEVRAGSLKQKLETYAATPAPAPADILFGLGNRGGADTVRVLWPAGIVQAETDLSAAKPSGPLAVSLKITEIDRKPSSCPNLYTWNGERFEFVTDFMGGGEMGYWEAPGVRNHPDPDEYVRIRDDQLKPLQGRFELRVTNELEEVTYIDRIQLIAVEHPADTEVYPNEGMVHPPRPFRLFTTRDAHPPAAAFDDHGRDVLSRVAKLDRQYPHDLAVHRIRGYAEPHALTLDLGQATKGSTLLLLTGWTEYAFSSDNVAAQQGGLTVIPPRLEVKDATGRWRTAVADIGIPVGRPQTMVIDLTGKFPTENREVRIVTNMRVHWDQILVDTSSGKVPVRLTRLDPVRADLRWRGFSAEVSPDGREPLSYDYDRVSLTSPWKVMTGRYTREGDVRELLARTDDIFVVSKPGDEISLSFDATRLRPLPQGWKRTFLLYADGFSKEMDLNSVSPDLVAPLPYHSMKSYGLAVNSLTGRPLTRSHREYVRRYNTRVVASPVPKIETAFGLNVTRQVSR